jgi:hypothetical protein
MMEFLGLIVLAITHAAVYCLGKNDGLAQLPDENAWVEVEKYTVDKRFEHLRWIEERKNHHDAG